MLVAILLLAGCANTDQRAFYGQSFIGVRLGDSGGFDSCSGENSGIRLGHEWRVGSNFKIASEYEHISHLSCGHPFNGKPEEYTDHVGVVFTYGGLK